MSDGPDEPTEVDIAAMAIVSHYVNSDERYDGDWWETGEGHREAHTVATVALNAVRAGDFKLLHSSEWERLQRLVTEVTTVPFGAYLATAATDDGPTTAEADRLQAWQDACQQLLAEVGLAKPEAFTPVPAASEEPF